MIRDLVHTKAARWWSSLALAAALALAPLGAATHAGSDEPAFTLASAIPDDVFIVTGGRYNPERQFLADEWGEVWQAFLDSGFLEELGDLLLAALDDGQAADVERVAARFRELAAAVNWGAVERGEVAFAERLNVPDTWAGIPFFPPDIVVLFRMDRETAARNFAGFAGLLEGFVDELNQALGTTLALDRSGFDAAGGAEATRLVTFRAMQLVERAPPIDLSIGLRGDVVFLSMGGTIRDEVAALLEGAGSTGAVADLPRFQSAFSGLPDAEDGYEYVDIARLHGDVERIFKMMVAQLESEMRRPGSTGSTGGTGGTGGAEGAEGAAQQGPAPEAAIAHAVVTLAEQVLGVLGLFDRSATVHYTDGRATYSDSVAMLVQGAADHPFYPVLAGGGVVEDFARYLPKETVTFDVHSGADLEALYGYLEGVVAGLGEPGRQALVAWQGFQEQAGFDVRADLLSWIGGAGVSATFDVDDRSAWITLVGVRDEEQARRQVATALDAGLKKLAELSAQHPQLAMLSLQARPAGDPDLAEFQRVQFMMSPEPVFLGVKDGWLILASSTGAVKRALATGRGEHPNVRENAALMAAALVPDEAADAVNFTDHSKDAEEMVGMLGAMSMMGGIAGMAIPDPKAREMMGKVFGLIGRLAPVVAAIDFYQSSASYTTFDGDTWTTRSVTRYRDSAPPPASDDPGNGREDGG